jgi:hypothetical protein
MMLQKNAGMARAGEIFELSLGDIEMNEFELLTLNPLIPPQ